MTTRAVHQQRTKLDEDWKDHALCAGMDVELFFPSRGSVGRGDHVPPEVAAVCRSCPVRVECLEYALETGDDGVWGGTSARQRRQMRRRRVDAARAARRLA